MLTSQLTDEARQYLDACDRARHEWLYALKPAVRKRARAEYEDAVMRLHELLRVELRVSAE